MLVDLVLVPAGHGKFRSLLDEASTTRPTRQPLYDGARELLALGYSPRTVVRVRYAGTIAMRGVVGELAKWTIEERDRGGLRKVLWKPHGKAVSSDGGAPLAAEDASDDGNGNGARGRGAPWRGRVMFADSAFGIPPSALLRFRARWPGGAVERHEYPAATAVAYADQLREVGLTIVWKPFEAPAAPKAAKPTRAERKAARRLALV